VPNGYGVADERVSSCLLIVTMRVLNGRYRDDVGQKCRIRSCRDDALVNDEYCGWHGLVSGAPDRSKGRAVQPSSRRQRTAVVPKVNEGSTQIVCPHCQVRGRVSTKQIKAKRGISGAKATGAVFTAGLSMFATGLSRKETLTEARCSNCSMSWTF